MRNARLALLAALLAAAGCNRIFGLDVPHYTPPPDGSTDVPADSAGGSPDTGPDVPADAGTGGVDAFDAGSGKDAAEGTTAPDASGAADAGTIVHGGPPLTTGCQGTAGPAPVNIEGLFCIDSTEVTNAQYAEFWGKVTPNDIAQPAYCQWNTSFKPANGTWPYPDGNDDYPVVEIDFCDGWSYCHWAGKRLCGRIGHTTATYSEGLLDGEMYYACSGGAQGPYVYSYGDTYDYKKCDTTDPDGGASGPILQPVKNNPACVSNVYPGLYNLSGSVEVWMDMCDRSSSPADGTLDTCRLSAPNYTDYRCDTDNYLVRNHPSEMAGLRCCSDVTPPPG
jgi:formylglycine-generating enzyme required for sulfatase activity